MDKDLEKEYLEDLDHYDEGMGIHSTSYGKCKERLIRLAKIDNANPSEFKIVNYKGQYYLQINVNDDEATQIQLPLLEDEIKDVQLAIDKFKQIDNTNPSEALENLESIALWSSDYDDVGCYNFEKEYNIIKQVLLKAQEQDQVLEIIKKKNVMAFLLKVCKSIDEYNFHTSEKDELTQEEFDLLKRYFK